jgi:predicted DNA-binding transcriptional regulator YafY
MTRTSTTKIRVLAVERLLQSGRKFTMKEIQRWLEVEYDIKVDKKAIYDDIYALNMFMPIEATSGWRGGFQVVDVLKRCDEYEE